MISGITTWIPTTLQIRRIKNGLELPPRRGRIQSIYPSEGLLNVKMGGAGAKLTARHSAAEWLRPKARGWSKEGPSRADRIASPWGRTSPKTRIRSPGWMAAGPTERPCSSVLKGSPVIRPRKTGWPEIHRRLYRSFEIHGGKTIEQPVDARTLRTVNPPSGHRFEMPRPTLRKEGGNRVHSRCKSGTSSTLGMLHRMEQGH